MVLISAAQSSLKKHIAQIPSAHRRQSILLVAFCRSLGESLTGNHEQQDSLALVIEEADKVLQSAVSNETQKMDDMTGNFENAVQEYCQIYPHRDYHNFTQKMKGARDEDRKLSKTVSRFRKKQENKHTSGPPCDQVSVDIFLGRKPLTLEETWIRSKIDNNPCLEAVLWMLEQHKGITLSQNPFFYKNLPESYGSDFYKDPLRLGEELRTVLPAEESHPVLIVLIDRDHDIFVKCDDGDRVFGNGWKPGGDLILKDRIAGKLEAAKSICQSMNGSSSVQ